MMLQSVAVVIMILSIPDCKQNLANHRRNKMSNLQIVRRFKFSQFDTGWAVVDADGNVQAFFDDVEGEPDAALTAAQEWIA